MWVSSIQNYYRIATLELRVWAWTKGTPLGLTWWNIYWNIVAKACLFNLNQFFQGYKITGEYSCTTVIQFSCHGIHLTAVLYLCAEPVSPAQKWTFLKGSALLKLVYHNEVGLWIRKAPLCLSLQWSISTSSRRRCGSIVVLLATSPCHWGRSWSELTPSSGHCVFWSNAVVETVPVVIRVAMSASVYQQKSPKNIMRYALFFTFVCLEIAKANQGIYFYYRNKPMLMFWNFM